MIHLAAAGVLVRELSSQHLEGATHGRRSQAPAPGPAGAHPVAADDREPQQSWIRRVASFVTQRSTEETWPRRKSRTSAC